MLLKPQLFLVFVYSAMANYQHLLKAQGIKKYYGAFQVLKNIDLQIAPGEIVAIMGASGAGKSTLLHILATLDKPDGGRLYLGEDDLLALPGNKLAKFRNKHIGFIFQFHNLLPEFTVLENVCLPGYIGGFNPQLVETHAKELLALLNLADRMLHKPAMLSGGEQQRAAVARALINGPRMVMADEPSGSLDAKNARALHQLIFDLRQQLGHGFVIATHNQTLADMADRKLIIEDGELIS